MKLTPYLFFTSLSLISNIVFCICYGFREGKIARKHIVCCGILETISIVFGAKLLDMVTNWEWYMECIQEAEWLPMLTAGYTFFGGIIGAILGVLIYAGVSKTDAIELANLFLPNLLLVYAIAKIGCYCNGCCKGIILGGYRLPIQLIEVGIYLLLFLLLRFRKMEPLQRLAWAGILFGALRFLLELLRENTGYMPVTLSQVLALCMCFAGIIYIRKKRT